MGEIKSNGEDQEIDALVQEFRHLYERHLGLGGQAGDDIELGWDEFLSRQHNYSSPLRKLVDRLTMARNLERELEGSRGFVKKLLNDRGLKMEDLATNLLADMILGNLVDEQSRGGAASQYVLLKQGDLMEVADLTDKTTLNEQYATFDIPSRWIIAETNRVSGLVNILHGTELSFPKVVKLPFSSPILDVSALFRPQDL